MKISPKTLSYITKPFKLIGKVIASIAKAVGKALAFILFMYCAGFFLVFGANDAISVINGLAQMTAEFEEPAAEPPSSVQQDMHDEFYKEHKM